MSSAGETMRGAAAAVLAGVSGIGRVYDAPPLQAALPRALVSIDLETDWSHKSGLGREVRLAAAISDKGERPERLRGLANEAEAALADLRGPLSGWRLVTMQFLRMRTVRAPGGEWTAVIEFRARLLEDG